MLDPCRPCGLCAGARERAADLRPGLGLCREQKTCGDQTHWCETKQTGPLPQRDLRRRRVRQSGKENQGTFRDGTLETYFFLWVRTHKNCSRGSERLLCAREVSFANTPTSLDVRTSTPSLARQAGAFLWNDVGTLPTKGKTLRTVSPNPATGGARHAFSRFWSVPSRLNRALQLMRGGAPGISWGCLGFLPGAHLPGKRCGRRIPTSIR